MELELDNKEMQELVESS